ncbi:MAG: hypothetical protein EPO41_15800 [Reyranella sp.]|uniref:hypothetical protein n=1 Tax=Reyranella sp. TaxID=1929291 RepID=UPI00120E8041|nr:hypothetical protein [Reyranella sp.]TAJ91337.1 MAG: hypothetical protein EPO41_15800 [Reyranella sp.]
MTPIRPLRKIAQALLLAFAAWVLAAGAASAHGSHAHGGHTQADDRPVTVMASQPVAYEESATPAASLPDGTEAPAAHEADTCPGGGMANHDEGCCTIACHAAMAAPGIDAWAGPGIASSVPTLMSDLLEGRCGGRSERPPRFT